MSVNCVDVIINDKLLFFDYKKKYFNVFIKIVDEKFDGVVSGFMFRKDSGKLVDEVNKVLKDMKKDGIYVKIFKKWFGEDVFFK